MNCKLRGCPDKARSRGLCIKHYTRLWRHGSVDAVNGHRNGNTKHDRAIRFRHKLGKSIRQISRELNISRWSVTKAIKG